MNRTDAQKAAQIRATKKYRAANPEKCLARQRRHYAKNKDVMNAKRRAWREQSEHQRRMDKKNNLKRYYGITIEEYEAMHDRQRGTCAICGKPETARTSTTRVLASLAVDHDSELGAIRELLCSRCNRGIGLLQHDPEILSAAAAYLLKHRPKQGEAQK